MNKWAIIGLGYIADKHIKAIENIGDRIIVASDIDERQKSKVNCKFYTDWYEMVGSDLFREVDYVSICAPNNLHFEMIYNCIMGGKKVVCEKPLAIHSEHFKMLLGLKDVYAILQLRYDERLKELKESIHKDAYYNGNLKIILHRDQAYWNGWRGEKERSGGLLYNIGIHYFDLLLWLFGDAMRIGQPSGNDKILQGNIRFPFASIDWEISLKASKNSQIRKLILNHIPIPLDKFPDDLHDKLFKDVIRGNGILIQEALRSLRLVENINKLLIK